MPGESRTVHGIHPVLEALRAHPADVERVYVLEGSVPPRAAAEILSRAREAQVRVERVPRERLQAMAESGAHQGVVARLREFAYATLEEVLAGCGGVGHTAPGGGAGRPPGPPQPRGDDPLGGRAGGPRGGAPEGPRGGGDGGRSPGPRRARSSTCRWPG